jgi:hypothetical protein
MTTIAARCVLPLPESSQGRELRGVSAGPSGDLILVMADRARTSPESMDVQVHRLTSAGLTAVDLPAAADWSYVQPLSGDRWLTVKARVLPKDAPNATIWEHGQAVQTFAVGDGVEDVQTSANDRIWVSYFDEGVFGSGRFGPAGLICFDDTGTVLTRYDALADEHGLPPIGDCYALNVASERETWLCYYSEFPLVRLCNGQFDRLWHPMPVDFASAFAVDGERVLLPSGHLATSLTLVTLVDLAAERREVVGPSGEPVVYTDAVGRAATLYLRSEHGVFAVDLSDV